MANEEVIYAHKNTSFMKAIYIFTVHTIECQIQETRHTIGLPMAPWWN